MNELTDLTRVRELTIELQEVILNQLDNSINTLKTLPDDDKKSKANIILCRLKESIIGSDLKKVIDSLIFFINNNENYSVEDIIKSLVIIRDGIYEKSIKLMKISRYN